MQNRYYLNRYRFLIQMFSNISKLERGENDSLMWEITPTSLKGWRFKTTPPQLCYYILTYMIHKVRDGDWRIPVENQCKTAKVRETAALSYWTGERRSRREEEWSTWEWKEDERDDTRASSFFFYFCFFFYVFSFFFFFLLFWWDGQDWVNGLFWIGWAGVMGYRILPVTWAEFFFSTFLIKCILFFWKNK